MERKAFAIEFLDAGICVAVDDNYEPLIHQGSKPPFRTHQNNLRTSFGAPAQSDLLAFGGNDSVLIVCKSILADILPCGSLDMTLEWPDGKREVLTYSGRFIARWLHEYVEPYAPGGVFQ